MINKIKEVRNLCIKLCKNQEFNADKIDALTSTNAIMAYEKGYVTFDQLKEFDADKINILTSTRAIMAYAKGYVTFDQLKEFDGPKINILTSTRAIMAYEKGYVTFDQLKEFDADKINILTCHDIRIAYEKGYVTFDELKEFDADKISILTSTRAIIAYEKGYVTFDQLKEFDADKIDALTSTNAIIAYEKRYVTFDRLKEFDADKIERLACCYNKIEKVKNRYIRLCKNANFNADKTDALTSTNAIMAYEKGYVTFDQLEEFDGPKINILTCRDYMTGHDIRIAYKKGYVTFDELKEFDIPKIKALSYLVSVISLIGVPQPHNQFNKFKEFDAAKIERLAYSYHSIEKYQSEVNLEDLFRLYDISGESFIRESKKLIFCIRFNEIIKSEYGYQAKVDKIAYITKEMFGEDPQNRNFAKKCIKEALNAPDTLWEKIMEMLHKLCVYLGISSNVEYDADHKAMILLFKDVVNRPQETSPVIGKESIGSYFVNKLIEERKLIKERQNQLVREI